MVNGSCFDASESNVFESTWNASCMTVAESGEEEISHKNQLDRLDLWGGQHFVRLNV